MWRASGVVAGVLSAALALGAARAQPAPAATAAPASTPDALRAQIAAALDEQAATIARTHATVTGKVGEIDALRARRLRAAYRLLRAPLPPSARPADRLAAARRRAAARFLITRDAAERGLLADEAARLDAAATRVAQATDRVPTLAAPPRLAPPARGTIARRFGTLVHERSGALLSRRGLDLAVEPRAEAVAPADGIVRYAGPIRGLDEGVLIDHGGYWTVVAKLGALAVPVGAPVTRGDRLGRAARGRVYLELRARIGPGGLPIDPEPHLD